MESALTTYFNSMGRVPLLTAQEERELARAVQKGQEAQKRKEAGERGPHINRDIKKGRDAKDRFIKANLRLVVSIAKRYPESNGMELADLIQEGNLGLEHAVDKFDWTRGFKFSTYATFWIRQSIGRAIDRNLSLIRVPEDKASALRAAIRRESEGQGPLTPDQAHLNMLMNQAWLDKPLSEESDMTLLDLVVANDLTPEDIVIEGANQFADILRPMLETLSDRNRYLIESKFGLGNQEPKSYRELGDEFNCSSEAIRRMIMRIIKRFAEDFDGVYAA